MEPQNVCPFVRVPVFSGPSHGYLSTRAGPERVDAANVELALQPFVLKSVVNNEGRCPLFRRKVGRFETIWTRHDLQSASTKHFGFVTHVFSGSEIRAISRTPVPSAADPDVVRLFCEPTAYGCFSGASGRQSTDGNNGNR